MLRKQVLTSGFLRGFAWSLCGVVVLSSVTLAASRDKRPITKPSYDPEAPRIGLFEGIEQDLLSVRMIAKDANGGNVLIENKTDQPITVELPEAIVGVQVLPQQPGAFGGGEFGGSGSGDDDNGGQNQQVGGGFGGGGFGGGGFGGGGFGGGGFGGGGGFFSIPAERVVRVPYNSVCLEHGKADPHPRVAYQVVPVEEYTDNAQLQELIKLVGTGKLDQQSAQAAAWHLANEMSWEELAAKKYNRIGAPDVPYFAPTHLYAAQEIVAESKRRSENPTAEQEPQPDRTQGRTAAR
jgi:hypothetical protein